MICFPLQRIVVMFALDGLELCRGKAFITGFACASSLRSVFLGIGRGRSNLRSRPEILR